ncbi:hypothetical protein PHYBLDRAFT_151000 [Phycomyces blakesleeanus NRRL 1555(-)]|uniref:Tc1-like transposase DDE domain-containing protein n=1 Tax=Phycomyces blakesleeanus (strain ATCC 8743b / DSM 1359 / FGSC 10004 / NBRC 33097 / NRRL 1555) TaxID=763407 RepID=A0A167KEK5_PHYB8|nr:hypothetical protein PHYBLDRAFT_151000 [Phycomyces blakesleeanus NRRL 1555(-)]OAD67915.1 hypothetical protein PHYBLDRAFT_151000 [Phycomyces blakesleeanus NRRL 1555(-)]|eukprot:XP_018285955.1 hypothetical protein PHYBLDRAFT_151000 [Phycomyces blakesleeanus NRRL 1555(-)]
MSTFLFDNGDSKVYDEQGRETHVYGMAVDNNQYSLEQFTTYDQYMDLKPPEKPVKIMEQEAEIPVSEDNSRIDLAGETVTGHYFDFVAATLDVLDKHEQFKRHYIIMDNAPIHTHLDIKKYIEGRSYGCVYLPPYFLELNPIEQLWSVRKNSLFQNSETVWKESLCSIIERK